MIQNVRFRTMRSIAAAGCVAALSGYLGFGVKATAAADETFEYSGDTGRVMGNNIQRLQPRAPGFFVCSR